MPVILFDLDDTLFDQKHCSRTGLAAVQKNYAGRIDKSIEQIELDYRELLEQWHIKVLDGSLTIEESRVERFRIMLSNEQTVATEEEAQHAAFLYREAYNAAYRPVPGAIDLLQCLKSDHRIGIVTNHVLSEQVKKISAIGVEPFVNELIVSGEVGVAKPAAKIFEVALSRLGGTPENTIMIGDSWPSDILGATALGIRGIWLNRYDRPCPDSDLATEIRSLEPVEDLVKLISMVH